MVAEPQAGARGQSQARAAADAFDGHRVDCPASADDAAGGGTQDLPVFAAKRAGGAAGPGVEYRYHLRANASRISVSDSGDGLVQPLRAGGRGYRTRWMAGSAWRHWKRRCWSRRRRFSTRTKGCSSRRCRSPGDCSSRGSRSAWTARGGLSTMRSWSGCGGV